MFELLYNNPALKANWQLLMFQVTELAKTASKSVLYIYEISIHTNQRTECLFRNVHELIKKHKLCRFTSLYYNEGWIFVHSI